MKTHGHVSLDKEELLRHALNSTAMRPSRLQPPTSQVKPTTSHLARQMSRKRMSIHFHFPVCRLQTSNVLSHTPQEKLHTAAEQTLTRPRPRRPCRRWGASGRSRPPRTELFCGSPEAHRRQRYRCHHSSCSSQSPSTPAQPTSASLAHATTSSPGETPRRCPCE